MANETRRKELTINGRPSGWFHIVLILPAPKEGILVYHDNMMKSGSEGIGEISLKPKSGTTVIGKQYTDRNTKLWNCYSGRTGHVEPRSVRGRSGSNLRHVFLTYLAPSLGMNILVTLPLSDVRHIYFSDIVKQLNVSLNHHHFYLIRSFHLYSFSFIFT